MNTRTKALAVIVLALILIDVLLTVISCQRRNAQPNAPGQPSRTPTETVGLIVVGPISSFTPNPSPTPTQLAPPTMTVAPSIAPRPTVTATATVTNPPQTLPKTGGQKPERAAEEHECN
jgi:type IV secretory pathway VirB10-like protein